MFFMELTFHFFLFPESGIGLLIGLSGLSDGNFRHGGNLFPTRHDLPIPVISPEKQHFRGRRSRSPGDLPQDIPEFILPAFPHQLMRIRTTLLHDLFRGFPNRDLRNFSRSDQVMNGKTFRPDRHELLFEILLLRHMQRQLELSARTPDIKRLFRHLLRRDNHIFRGHSLRRMRRHHPAVFHSPELLRQPDRGQLAPVGIQQQIFVPVVGRNRQTAVVDLEIRRPQVHGEADDVAFPDRQRNRIPDVNAVPDQRRLHRPAVAQNEFASSNLQNLRHFARSGNPFHFRIEENLHADLIIFDVAELRLRPSPRAERFHQIGGVVSYLPRRLHLLPNLLRKQITLPVGRRNRDTIQGALPVIGQSDEILRGPIQVSGFILMDVTMFIQMLKSFPGAPHRNQLNPAPVLLNLLPVNLRKTRFRDAGMLLQQPEEVARLDR